MSNQPVIDALKQVLADSYALYLKTQNYHWNVEGANFFGLHKLFEEQYTDLAQAIDEIAERIRALGAKAPGNFKEFAKLTKIADGDHELTSTVMVHQLVDDQQLIVKSLKKLARLASSAEDEATADMAIGRIQVHEKAAWMMRSILGGDTGLERKGKSKAA